MNHDSKKYYIQQRKCDKSHYLAPDIVTLVHLFKTFKNIFYFIDTGTCYLKYVHFNM